MVVGVEGSPQLQRASDHEPGPLEAFDLVHVRDHIVLPEGAAVELRFTDRHRRWVGPLELVVGEGEARSSDGTTPDELQTVVVLLRRAELGEGGHTLIRGQEDQKQDDQKVDLSDEERAEMESARSAYLEQRSTVAEDDITPEMRLIAVLANYDQHSDVVALLVEAIERCSTCEVPKTLHTALTAE